MNRLRLELPRYFGHRIMFTQSIRNTCSHINVLRRINSPICLGLSLSLLLFTSLNPNHENCVAKSRLEELDSLFNTRGASGNLRKCLLGLEHIYKENASKDDRSEICYRLCRANYNLISSKDPLDAGFNKKDLATEALKYAQEAVDVAPNDFRSHYWSGIGKFSPC